MSKQLLMQRLYEIIIKFYRKKLIDNWRFNYIRIKIHRIKMPKKNFKRLMKLIRYFPMKKKENYMMKQEWLMELKNFRMHMSSTEIFFQKLTNKISRIMNWSTEIVKKKNKTYWNSTISRLVHKLRYSGNVRLLLENIICSKNEDVPRFLKFYDEMIKEGKLNNYKAY